MKKGNLLSQSITGISIVSIVTGFKAVIEVATQLMLVHLLLPEIFGITAFAYLIVNFVGSLANIQARKGIIQRRGNVQDFLDVSFTIEIFLGVFATVCLIILAPKILTILGKSDVTGYVQVLSISLLLNKLLLPQAVLEKELKFMRASIPTIIGLVTWSGVTLALATAGFGAWSIIYGILARTAIQFPIVWKLVPLTPRLRFDLQVAKQILKFGLPLTGAGILTYYYWNVDDFMVGKMLGNKQLGYYWMAFKFPHYILIGQRAISSVVLPAFSKAKDDEQLKRGFELVTKYSAIIALLPCVIALSMAEPTIKFLFGEAWLPSKIPFQIFMVLVSLRMIAAHWSDVYISKGKTNIFLYFVTINAVGITGLGYLGIKYYGIVGISFAVLGVMVITILFVTNVTLRKMIQVSYLRILYKPLIISVMTYGFIFILLFVIHPDTKLFYFTMLFASVSFYSALIILFDYKELHSIYHLLKNRTLAFWSKGKKDVW